MHYRRIIKQAIIDEGNSTPTYRADIDADHPFIVSIENRGNSTFYVRVCRNKPEPEPEPKPEIPRSTSSLRDGRFHNQVQHP